MAMAVDRAGQDARARAVRTGVRVTVGGDVDLGPLWAGESAALVDAVLPAGEIVRRIAAEVDWDQEIGGLTRVNLALGGPAGSAVERGVPAAEPGQQPSPHSLH